MERNILISTLLVPLTWFLWWGQRDIISIRYAIVPVIILLSTYVLCFSLNLLFSENLHFNLDTNEQFPIESMGHLDTSIWINNPTFPYPARCANHHPSHLYSACLHPLNIFCHSSLSTSPLHHVFHACKRLPSSQKEDSSWTANMNLLSGPHLQTNQKFLRDTKTRACDSISYTIERKLVSNFSVRFFFFFITFSFLLELRIRQTRLFVSRIYLFQLFKLPFPLKKI